MNSISVNEEFLVPTQLVYFDQTINQIKVHPYGYFELSTGSNQYRIVPFQFSGTGYFDPNIVLSPFYLNQISEKIRLAFPKVYEGFNANYAYSITWFFSEPIFYQVILAADKTHMFMIVNYVILNETSESTVSYAKPNGQEVDFKASTIESNCGVPGQFVFQFNTYDNGKYAFCPL